MSESRDAVALPTGMSVMSESRDAVALPPVARTLAIAGGLRLALADWVGSAPVNITLKEY